MGNLHRAMASGATVLDFPFGGLKTTLNYQYRRRNTDLCGIFQWKYTST